MPSRYAAELARGKGGRLRDARLARLISQVPCGTIIRRRDGDPEDPPIAELLEDGERALLMVGGRGGRGNASFKTGRNNAPVIAERGEKGQQAWIDLELKARDSRWRKEGLAALMSGTSITSRGTSSLTGGRRCRHRGRTQRRKEHAAVRGLRRQAQDRQLPVHDPGTQPGRLRDGPADHGVRGCPRAARGRAHRRGPRPRVPAPLRAVQVRGVHRDHPLRLPHTLLVPGWHFLGTWQLVVSQPEALARLTLRPPAAAPPRVLVHVIDGTSSDPIHDFHAINLELELFNPELADKPQVVVYNKMDLPDSADYYDLVSEHFKERGLEPPIAISAATGRGVVDVVRKVGANPVTRCRVRPARSSPVSCCFSLPMLLLFFAFPIACCRSVRSSRTCRRKSWCGRRRT